MSDDNLNEINGSGPRVDHDSYLHMLFASQIDHEGQPAIGIMPAHYDPTAHYVELIGVEPDDTHKFNASDFAALVRNDMDQFLANSVVEILEELDKAPQLDRYATAHHTLINRLSQQPASFVVNLLASAVVGFIESIDKDVNVSDISSLTDPDTKPEPG